MSCGHATECSLAPAPFLYIDEHRLKCQQGKRMTRDDNRLVLHLCLCENTFNRLKHVQRETGRILCNNWDHAVQCLWSSLSQNGGAISSPITVKNSNLYVSYIK